MFHHRRFPAAYTEKWPTVGDVDFCRELVFGSEYGMKSRLQPTKNTASIQLTEPVIFLRGSTDSVVRGRNPENGVPQPAILRGLLTLALVKPTKITSIEVELEGWTRTAWSEGMSHIFMMLLTLI